MRVAVLVLGIIGAILALPAAICGGACAAGLTALTDTSSSISKDAGNLFMAFGLFAALFSLIGSIGAFAAVGKTVVKIIFAFILLIATILMILNSILTLNWIMGFIPIICMILATIFAFVAKPSK